MTGGGHPFRKDFPLEPSFADHDSLLLFLPNEGHWSGRAKHYALHTRILLGGDAYTDEQKKLIPPAVWQFDTHPGSGRKVLFVGVHVRHHRHKHR